jgi:hypothetical protein
VSSEHLVVHSGVTAGGDLCNFSATGSSIGLASREVVGHLGVELLNRLLLGAGLATSTTLSTAASLATSACATGSSLLGSSRLWLVFLGLTVN